MPKLTDLGGRPHSGQQGSTQVGIVIDNVDPEELGRIKVKFPTLQDEPVSFWIRQASPMAGTGRGFYSLPEKEDEVNVSFMQGNQDTGVITGQFWNGKDKPPKEAKDGMPGPDKQTVEGAKWSRDQFTDGSRDLKKNDRRFWKSRSGSLFVFDDTDGKESIQMWDGSHTLSFALDTKSKRIILANTGGDIHIRTKNDFYLEAGNDIKLRAGNDIKLESMNDTWHHVANNWKVKVDNQASLSSSSNFGVSSDANLSLSAAMTTSISGDVNFEASGGSTAKLSGGALTEVSGGIVKIN
jgi:uncharacterized protein involved in type VI secretion and phage assembly